MSRIHEKNFIDIESLPHKDGIGKNKGRKVVDWLNSIGFEIKYVCCGNEGYLTILDYYKDKRKVKILINNVEHICTTDSLLSCEFGRNIFKVENLNYKYALDSVIDTNNTSYLVLKHTRLNNGKKAYRLKCLKCGEEVLKAESQINNGYGCLVCDGKKAKQGLNDMWTTDKELANMLLDKDFGYTHTTYSQKNTDWVCPICETIVKKKSPYVIYKHGLCCPVCGKTKSYPNRFMYALLKNANINFKSEKAFNWSDNKRYDFYLDDFNIIIEMHGKQHYDKDFFDTCEEIKANDKYKKSLALSNNISKEKYIEIDSRYSEFTFIKENVTNSILKDYIDFSMVDWNKVAEDITLSPLKEACRLWDEGNHDIQNIADIIGYHLSSTSEFLRKGQLLGITTYTTKFSNELGFQKSRDTWYQRFGRPFKCNQNNFVFGSPTVFEKVSENIFGYKISNHAPINILLGKQKDTKREHFTFSYITREEFNKTKDEYPEMAFGDKFDNLIPQIKRQSA